MIKKIFWNIDERRLRTLWRLVLQFAFMAVCALGPIVLTGELLSAARKQGVLPVTLTDEVFDKVINLILGPLFAVLVVVSIWLAGRLLDRRRFADFGVHLKLNWWLDLGFGLVLGAVLMGLIFVLEFEAGWVIITGTLQSTSPALPLSLALFYPFVKVLCVGVYEEFISRGYHLKNMAEGFNGLGRIDPRAALILSMLISAIVFGVLHIANPNATFISTFALFLNGILLAMGYILTGELGLPIGLHISWNLFQGAVFGFPVSGDKEAASLLVIQQSGSTVMTGGAFGPEAGVIGIAAMLLGVILILVWVRLRYGSVGINQKLATPELLNREQELKRIQD